VAKAGELDWSHLYKNGHIEKPEHLLSKPLKKGMTGADSVMGALVTGQLPVLQDAPRQPNKEEFEAVVAKMLPTEEQIKKAEYEWENRFNIHLRGLSKPIDHLNKSKIDDRKWGQGKSFNDMLTEEEVLVRNRCITE
jgi:hypothetical protein